MNITKTARGIQESGLPDREQLEEINRLTRRPLTAEEVYVFALRLCDNQVDRDNERFSPKTLEELAPMFVGKSGIFDHNWSARGQSARIFRTQLVQEPETLTRAGDPCCWLKGWAYMVRTRENEGLIAEIEGGIKKEVSVGCAVKQAVCSICGASREENCGHKPGEEYDGRLCFISLEGAADAYEFSFVAVPAQPAAGVVKGARKPKAATLKELLKDYPTFAQEVEQLEQEAQLGRRHLKELREDVVRLGALADPESEVSLLKSMAEKLDEPQLLALRRTYEARAGKRYPLAVQLPHGAKEALRREEDGAFLI